MHWSLSFEISNPTSAHYFLLSLSIRNPVIKCLGLGNALFSICMSAQALESRILWLMKPWQKTRNWCALLFWFCLPWFCPPSEGSAETTLMVDSLSITTSGSLRCLLEIHCRKFLRWFGKFRRDVLCYHLIFLMIEVKMSAGWSIIARTDVTWMLRWPGARTGLWKAAVWSAGMYSKLETWHEKGANMRTHSNRNLNIRARERGRI